MVDRANDDQAIRRALEGFLSEVAGAPVQVERFKRFTVGFSWATFGAEAVGEGAGKLPGRSLILRLGADDGLYAPYSAVPQFEVLKALEPTGLPIPRAYWHGDDRARFGLPFLVCERIAGDAPLPAADGPDDLVERHRPAIAAQFIGALAGIHGFAWEGSILAPWGIGITRETAALAQVEWCRQEYRRVAPEPVPAIVWALHWLKRNAPVAPRLSLIHGDYRIGNFLAEGAKITAVLDWESAHIGDPHEDIGWAVLPQFSGGSGRVCRMLPEPDFMRAYEEAGGVAVDPRSVRYYAVLALLKLALVNLAASWRFAQPGAKDIRMAALGTQAPSTLRQLQKAIEALA